MALLMQLSAHFQHEVQAMLLMTTGTLFRISMMSSGQTTAQTPVLSHCPVSIEMVMSVLSGKRLTPEPRAVVEPFQAAV
jgi:hypothetical protein